MGGESKMGKFSTGLFAGAIIGMSVAVLDKKSVKKAKRMVKSIMSGISWY